MCLHTQADSPVPSSLARTRTHCHSLLRGSVNFLGSGSALASSAGFRARASPTFSRRGLRAFVNRNGGGRSQEIPVDARRQPKSCRYHASPFRRIGANRKVKSCHGPAVARLRRKNPKLQPRNSRKTQSGKTRKVKWGPLSAATISIIFITFFETAAGTGRRGYIRV